MVRSAAGLFLAASLVAMLACSADARPPGMGGGGTPNVPGGGNADACGATTSANEICITSVKGQVLDGDGHGTTLPINLCNANVCFSTRSDDGIFNVQPNSPLDLSTFLIHAYGYPDYSDTFVRLTRATSSVVTLDTPVYVARLGFTGAVVPSSTTAATPLTAGPVTITLPPDATTTFYPAHDARAFRAGAVPQPTRFDPSMVALFALGPFGARISSPAEIAIALPSPMPDGTELAIVVLEDDVLKNTAGTFSVAGKATVTGGVARSASGVGIHALTWVGLRNIATP
jgi:hypothetical protein